MMQNLYTFFDRLSSPRISRIGTLCIRTLVNIIVPIYYRLSITPMLKSKQNNCLTVSLTSFPARINKVWIVIESLLRQKKKADRIVLYLSEVDFPDKTLPKSLLRLKKKGVEIMFVEGNLRSHKKWYYAFQDYRNEYVVTADDDIVYPSNMLVDLWNAHLHFPSMGIARYAKQVMFTLSGVAPYNTWGKVKNNPSASISFGSGGGYLFPVRNLNKGIFAIDVFMEICPNADDLWLYTFMCISGMRTYLINGETCSIINIQIRHDSRLTVSNCMEGGNDLQLAGILDYIKTKYGLTIEIFKDVDNRKVEE